MKLEYYKEIDTGDYLCVDVKSIDIYIKELGKFQYEGRATAIANMPTSICTTTMSKGFIEKDCVKVKKSEVPAEYLEMF